jgi:hypothetical protein
MRLLLVIIALALFAGNALGIMYLTSGSDAYGKGLSYPGYSDPPAIRDFVTGDHTSQLAPVFLGATLHRPEFANISSINRSHYSQFIDSGWRFNRQPASYPIWTALGSSYDGYVPSVREFVQPDWRPDSLNYQIPVLQRFMDDERNWEPPELSTEDYPGIDVFLDHGEDISERHIL